MAHVLPATCTFICQWNEPSFLYSLGTDHHCALASTYFIPRWG